MEEKKARNISIVLVGLGIILLFLPLFDMFQEQKQALLFGGMICFLGAFMIRQLAKRD